MPFVRMPDGSTVEVGADALFADPTASTPLNLPIPGEQYFTSADVERARSEEKAKLYSRIEQNQNELTTLREQVGTLTAAQQAEEQRLEEERARLETEARRQEEEDLSAKELIARRDQDWEKKINDLNDTWQSRWEQSEQERQAAEALREKEAEFTALREYTQQQVANHTHPETGDIAPQFVDFIGGNSREEVDASIALAVTKTQELVAEISQFQPQQLVGPDGQPVQQQVAVPQPQQVLPPLPGTRPTGGPTDFDPAASASQQLTAQQIAEMPMSEWAKIRGRVIGSNNQQNRGLYG